MSKRIQRPFATIKAGHVPVRCVWLSEQDSDNEEADGFFAVYESVLAAKGGLKPALGAEVLVHELLHVIASMAGINDNSMPEDEEEMVTRLTSAASSLVAHNQEAAHWLVDAFHSSEPTIRGAWAKRKRRK